MSKGWIGGWVLPLILVGCAAHDPSRVQIEDRSLSGTAQGREQQPKARPLTEPAPESVERDSAGAGEGEAPSTSSSQERTRVTPAPAYQPPAASAPRRAPSGALLALLEQAEQQHQSGNNQQALSSLERAQRIAPRDPMVYLQLARLRLDMNDRPRAEQLARKGLALSAGDPEMEETFKILLRRIGTR